MTREEASKVIKDGLEDMSLDFADEEQYEALTMAIQALEQERTGHWILQPSNKEQGERDFIWWKCSECGQVIFSETEKDRKEFHAFCGRCGAKMVELQDKDIIWYDKRNYSEIVVKPQESEDKE